MSASNEYLIDTINTDKMQTIWVIIMERATFSEASI